MALGRTALGQIRQHLTTLNYTIRKIDDEYTTFDSVVNNLRIWADETVIGDESIQELRNLLSELDRARENARRYCDAMDEMCTEQTNINSMQ